MNRMSHVADDGTAQMVDVGGKAASRRQATAAGLLRITAAHRDALASLPKGDALTVAQIAGIQAAKKTSELIPLCHQLPLSNVDVMIRLGEGGLSIEATARTDAQTGVEMEAYTAVVIAGITLIDMLKGVSPDLVLTDVRLLEKTGGKQDWKRESA